MVSCKKVGQYYKIGVAISNPCNNLWNSFNK